MSDVSGAPDGEGDGPREDDAVRGELPRVDEVFADAIERQLGEQRLLNELLADLRDGLDSVREDLAHLDRASPPGVGAAPTVEPSGSTPEVLRRLDALEERLAAQRPSLEARLDALEAELAAVRSTSRAQLEEIRAALVALAEQDGTG